MRLSLLPRRQFLPALLAAAILWLRPLLGSRAAVQAAEIADLKERLEKDLRARRPAEFAFIATVVALVEADQMPRSLVDSTYLWARKKPVNRFQYFQQALRLRARRLGIEL